MLGALDLPGTRLGEGSLDAIVSTIGAQPHLFADLVGSSETSRWWLLLLRERNFEVRLLAWDNDQESDWHDHGGASGAFFVASGTLRERLRGSDGVTVESRTLATGRHASFGPGHVHDVAHVAGHPAVSVHAYSPPLTSLTYYDQRQHGFVARAVVPEPSFSGRSGGPT